MLSRTHTKDTKVTKTHERVFFSTIRFVTGSLRRDVLRACFVSFVCVRISVVPQ